MIVIAEEPAFRATPLSTKLPPKVKATFAVFKVIPLLMVNAPLATVAELSVLVLVEPAKVRMLNVVADALRVWAAPPKLTVELLAVNNDPVPPHAVALVLFSLSVLVSPFKVPAVRVTSPVKVCVKLVPKSSVPPEPLMVKDFGVKSEFIVLTKSIAVPVNVVSAPKVTALW